MTADERMQPGAGRNRLADEKSPYLIQHAHQPVDWYPWGEEAFARARREDKPVLVSVGYSTCHWCHVMAEESFDDPDIADLMNRHFVSIKVDREERPDIDSFLITAVSAITGSAGWPLNAFLTPDGRPFFGGTYFPPGSRRQMPGWADVLTQIQKAWNDPSQRAKITESAQSITEAIRKHMAPGEGGAGAAEIPPDAIGGAVRAFAADFDQENGGFSTAPKFPMPPVLAFLTAFCRYAGESGTEDEKLGQEALGMVSKTLRAMARGGIYDHVGGGFHRYSTDPYWHLPHFEKMLYDNAQLIMAYTEAYELLGEPLYEQVVRESADYVLREMTHPEGGFFSAEDADSVAPDAAESGQPGQTGGHPEKREGAFYVWRQDAVQNVLKEHPDPRAAAVFAYVFDVREQGNVGRDPFGEFKGQNVLYQGRSIEAAAARFDRSPEEIRAILDQSRRMLFRARLERPRPHLDDKVLTAWNGLMISALARASRTFEIPGYLEAAERAADFIYSRLYDPNSGQLFRRWREGEAKIEGLADDYAYLIQGLADLYEAGFASSRLKWAFELMDRFLERFTDAASGAVYLTPEGHDPFLAVQIRDAIDNVAPSAASAAANSLVRLYRVSGRAAYESAYRSICRAMEKQAAQSPKAVPYLLRAVLLDRSLHVHLVIAGRGEEAATSGLIAEARRSGGMGQSMVLLSDAADREGLSRVLPEASEMGIPEKGASARVCYNQSCRPPVDTPEKLARELETAFQ